MPRETLKTLDSDIERLLLAGGPAAASDDALMNRKGALEGFAAKIPALGKVAEQLGRVLGAKPRVATTELLNLSSVNLQLRAAQSQADKPAGELKKIPALPPMETELPFHEVDSLVRALRGETETASPAKLIESAAERGAVRDLRLLPLWIEGLRHTAFGDVIATEVIPKLGDAAVPFLEAALNFKGGATDGRRLWCLVKIQGKSAKPLVDKALEEGTPELRVSALECLAEIDPAAMEPLALKLARSDRAAQVRGAAAQVLASGTGEEALEVLLELLKDTDYKVHRGAQAGLSGFAHPKTMERVIALLTPEALDVKEYKPPKPKKGVKLTPAQQKAQEKQQREELQKINERVGYLNRIFHVLVRRAMPDVEGREPDLRGIPRLLDVLTKHGFERVQEGAADALQMLEQPPQSLVDAMKSLWEHKNYSVSMAAKQLIFKHPKEAFDLFSPLFSDKELAAKKPRAFAITDYFADIGYAEDFKLDPRWNDLMFGLLDSKNKSIAESAMYFLSDRKDPRIYDRTIEALKDPKTVWDAIDRLSNLGDKRAVPHILAVLDNKKIKNAGYQIFDVCRTLDDPSAAPVLRAWLEKQKKLNSWQEKRMRETLSYLERDRTLA